MPARGDVFGFFPASLLVSADRGQSFSVVAATARAMFGFALSPDGSQLAYGGPFDGLFVGPSGGGPFTKVSSLGVRCLKWGARGLYACGSQPPDAFTLGLSPNADGVFEPLYDARTTCPMGCAPGSAFQTACQAPWSAIGPAIGAPSTCDVPWADAGSSDGGAPDGAGGTSNGPDGSSASDSGGSTPNVRPSADEPRGGCACRLARRVESPWRAAIGSLLALAFAVLRRAKSPAHRARHSAASGSSKQR